MRQPSELATHGLPAPNARARLQLLIVPDKFKGSLTAPAAANAIARGWRKARPGDSLDVLPMSDGGDGFGAVLGQCLGAAAQTTATVDAAHRPCRAEWWWEPGSRTAIIESAKVIGLASLSPGKYHPFDLDTFGLGAIFRAAAKRGARRCIVGIGGSATNDGGFGLARALGWEFLDREDRPIGRWTDLERLERVRAPARQRGFQRLIVAVDVQNPLLGVRGATRVYGPQKGLCRRDFDTAERSLRGLARIVASDFGRDFARAPGAGAAGGLGFGLLAFAGARLEPGFDLFARLAKLDRRLRRADLVLTGEGSIDASTFMGKGVGQIARRCRRRRIPCIGLAGVLADPVQAARLFTGLRALTDLATVAQARSEPARWLELLAEQTAKQVHRRRGSVLSICPMPARISAQRPARMAINEMQAEFFRQLAEPFTGEALFDGLPELVFFIKNSRGEYVVVNQTLVERCGRLEKRELVGRRADEVFPPPFGSSYRAQDERVLRSGEAILNQLELHFYASGQRGWCLTNKLPLRGRNGNLLGLVGVSKDLVPANERSEDYSRVAKAIQRIQAHYDEPLRVKELASGAGLSEYQFEQRIRRIFQLTAGQLIQKVRMEVAVRRLRETDDPIAALALDCGYSDQSAFTRQFRQTIGLSPSEYRQTFRPR